MGLEESYLHAYGFATPSVQALLLPRHDPAYPDGRHVPSGMAAEVLAFVAENGPTHPASLAERFGREREVNGWGGMSKATTRALQVLLHHGLLRVAGRTHGVRIYEAMTVAPSIASPEERVERLTLLVARILAPVSMQKLECDDGAHHPVDPRPRRALARTGAPPAIRRPYRRGSRWGSLPVAQRPAGIGPDAEGGALPGTVRSHGLGPTPV